ncbi:GNAT family N-acetyltransferase [Undibacterium sp. Ji50W]|uniref:GNAT family N-acetyltransferase n=1 Tax=Undibacterium sp. Ji50W TaxID=3413041 RepID=UPI003BEF9F14
MSYQLVSVSLEHLRDLERSVIPATLNYHLATDALPPAFVAARALSQIDVGAPAYWCSTFYIVSIEDRLIVGSCGFKSPPQNGRVEIGYGISPECRRQGAASAAVRSLLQLAFAGGATSILATVSPNNLASTRVVQKLGFESNGNAVDDQQELLTHWLAIKLSETI